MNTTKNYIAKSKKIVVVKETSVDSLRLVRSGEDFFHTAHEMIRQANKTIYLLTYILKKDQTGERIAISLLDAVNRNVKVYVMADSYASSDLPKSFVRSMQQAGIQFIYFNPFFKAGFYFGRRLHAKVLVIDGKIALVGGMNIADRYNDTINSHAWLDYAVKISGVFVADIESICKSLFDHGKVKKQVAKLCNQSLPKNVRVVINDWVYQKNEITQIYVRMFQQAKEHITILCSYFIPGIHIRRLIRNATERGVHVEIIMAGDSDVPIAKYAERWLYDWLLRHQVVLYEYRPSILHGKIAMMDNSMATIGSYNVNNISAFASVEMNVIVEEKLFLQNLSCELDLIKQKECTLIDKHYHLNHKTWLKQLTRWFSYVLYRSIFMLTTFYYKQKN